MKPQFPFLSALGLIAFACAAGAAPRTSADYSISSESIDQGGALLTSANYAVNASANDTGATGSEPTCGYLVKSSYIGQLFDVVGALPTAPVAEIVEGGTVQLGALQVLDDATVLPFSPSLATWSVGSGPITSITPNGFATAALVYQNTSATVRLNYQGFTGTLSLAVLNVNTDDFGIYAKDGIPDDWQVQYFGQNNPNAAPDVDATGSGQTNLFKYVAGLNPTDPASVFRVTVQPVSGQPSQRKIVFSPVVSDRAYTVVYKNNLTDGTWTPLAGASQSDNGQQRTVIDTDAAGKAKFYRVQISKP